MTKKSMPARGWSALGGNKYWVIFKNGFQTNIVYRFNTAAGFVAEMLSLLIMAYLWLSIYQQGGVIGNYTLKGLVGYYVLTQFISLTIRSNDIGREVGDAIRQGDLNMYLLKPISFMGKTLFNNLGSLSYKLSIFTLAFIPVILLWPGLIELRFMNVILFLFFLTFGFLINFLFAYLIGILTFYLGFVMGLNYIALTFSSFFAGQLLPLDILPPALGRFVEWLPFKFIAFVPINAISGRLAYEQMPLLIGQGAIWVAVLFGFVSIVYKRGLIKYEAYGS